MSGKGKSTTNFCVCNHLLTSLYPGLRRQEVRRAGTHVSVCICTYTALKILVTRRVHIKLCWMSVLLVCATYTELHPSEWIPISCFVPLPEYLEMQLLLKRKSDYDICKKLWCFFSVRFWRKCPNTFKSRMRRYMLPKASSWQIPLREDFELYLFSPDQKV